MGSTKKDKYKNFKHLSSIIIAGSPVLHLFSNIVLPYLYGNLFCIVTISH